MLSFVGELDIAKIAEYPHSRHSTFDKMEGLQSINRNDVENISSV